MLCNTKMLASIAYCAPVVVRQFDMIDIFQACVHKNGVRRRLCDVSAIIGRVVASNLI